MNLSKAFQNNLKTISEIIEILKKGKDTKLLLSFLSEFRKWNELIISYENVLKREKERVSQSDVFSQVITVMRKSDIPSKYIMKFKNCIDKYRFQEMVENE